VAGCIVYGDERLGLTEARNCLVIWVKHGILGKIPSCGYFEKSLDIVTELNGADEKKKSVLYFVDMSA
jgi:hypothetical protein